MDNGHQPLDVFVTHPTQIDVPVFRLWLQGYSVNDVYSTLFAKGRPMDASDMDRSIVHNYIRSQYRIFLLLEPYLENPTSDEGKDQSILYQPLIPLTRELCTTLLECYYSVDDLVFREVLGKKLNANIRREVEEIHERSNIRIRSCRRQFDNMKNVYKVMEEIEGNLTENISRIFLISKELALRYAVFIFTNYNRLDISKKRLQNLSLADIEHCALLFMSWTDYNGTGCDLDSNFIPELTEIKFALNNSSLMDEYCQLVLSFCNSAGLHLHSKALKSHMKVFLRCIIQIGGGLKQEKEFRDIFIDIIEKIIDPLKKLGLSSEDASVLFKGAEVCFLQLGSDIIDKSSHFSRYITGLKLAVNHLYDIV